MVTNSCGRYLGVYKFVDKLSKRILILKRLVTNALVLKVWGNYFKMKLVPVSTIDHKQCP